MDRIEDTERKDFHSVDFIGRIVPAATNHSSNWEDTRICGRKLSEEPGTELCQILVTRSSDVLRG